MSSTTEADLMKLKVVELRAELSQRGLDTKGTKAVLVERLLQAMKGEPSNAEGDNQEEMGAEDDDNGGENEADILQDDEKAEAEADHMDGIPDPEENDAPEDEDDLIKEEPPEKENFETSCEDSEMEVKPEAKQEDADIVKEEDSSSLKEVDTSSVKEVDTSSVKEVDTSSVKEVDTSSVKEGDTSSIKEETSVKEETAAVPSSAEESTNAQEEAEKDQTEQKDYTESQEGGKEKHQERRGEKRTHEESRYKHERDAPVRPTENEPEWDDTKVLLDWYNSDMHLKIDKESFFRAEPMIGHGFGYVWAGARATYGFISGRICYECKILEDMQVEGLEDEPNPNVVRVGWSTEDTSMQLGEEPLSYGYGGTAKASESCKFQNYGVTFAAGNVVGAYLDMESDPVTVSFTVDGSDQGVAFEIQKDQLEGKALFPHVLLKNCKIELNFGERPEGPHFPHPDRLMGFTYASDVEVEKRVRGTKAPEKRSDCEIMLMCGLPSCGKTTWANQYVKEHPEKKYNILGTNFLIDKMKVMGLNRKKNYAGRWDVLFEKCNRCLNVLLTEAQRRRRNFILDQTNVYPSAQRRKMKGFEGFKRRAVVIVPPEEEYKRRQEKVEKEEGKDVPDKAVLEMKANFKLPMKGDLFDEVDFAELDRSEAEKLVAKYNQEGIDAGFTPKGPPPEKRFRPDRGDRNDRDGRSYHQRSSTWQGPGQSHGRGSGFGGFRGSDRGWRGGWRGGPPRGGGPPYRSGSNDRYKDRRDWQSPSPRQDRNSNYGRGGGYGGWQGGAQGYDRAYGQYGGYGNYGPQAGAGASNNYPGYGNWNQQGYYGNQGWGGYGGYRGYY